MTEQDGHGDRVVGTPFAVVPEWVLYAEVSDRAVRLYTVLQRHVNSGTGYAHPGRKRLAQLLRCSVDAVDRSVAELERAGALQVVEQYREGTQVRTANAYYLRADEEVAARVRPPHLRTTAATVAAPQRPLELEHLDEEAVSSPSASTPRAGAGTADDAQVLSAGGEVVQLGLAGMPPERPRPRRTAVRNPVWDQFDDVLGPPTNDSERGKRARACSMVQQSLQAGVAPPGTSATTPGLAVRAVLEYALRDWGSRGITVTDMAVAANWRTLVQGMASGQGSGLTAQQVMAQARTMGVEL